MNCLEFDEVIDVLDIYNPVTCKEGKTGNLVNVHLWKDVILYHGGSTYAIVEGKIPLEVAFRIYIKYPDNNYGIRINGGANQNKPSEWAEDDIFRKEIRDIKLTAGGFEEYKSKIHHSMSKLKKRTNDKKYITHYHVDTKEGLLILLTEMKDYYLRKENKKETEVEKYDELLSQVVSNLLNKMDPTISGYDWMQGSEYKDSYNSMIKKGRNTIDGLCLTEITRFFDEIVNPFLNSSFSPKEMKEYLKKVDIHTSLYKENGRDNCCAMYIIDRKTKNSTTYCRNNGFSFDLAYEEDDEKYFRATHYYINGGKFYNGDILRIKYSGKNVEKGFDIKLNICTGKIIVDNEEATKATNEQIVFVYTQLLKAIQYASRITICDVKKDEKPFVLDNKNGLI